MTFHIFQAYPKDNRHKFIYYVLVYREPLSLENYYYDIKISSAYYLTSNNII